MFAGIYFRGFFELSLEFIDIRFKDNLKEKADLSFFYAGIILLDYNGDSKRFIGHMHDENKSDLLISKLSSEELFLSWRHPVFDDYISLSLFRDNDLWMVGDYQGEIIGRGITLCLLPKKNIMELLAESCLQSNKK